MSTSRWLRLGLLISLGVGLVGQTGREAYRQAYGVWQERGTNLEHDAGTGGPAQIAQADRAATAAASFEATRLAYLKSVVRDATERRKILATPATRSSPELTPQAVADMASAELRTVNRTIAKFADDKDRAIQQLRQSLERERVALTALNESIQIRQKAVVATSEASDALEQARVRTAQAFSDQASQLSKALEQLVMEGDAWAEYYDKLARGIQAANEPPRAVALTGPTENDSFPRIPRVRFVGSFVYPMVNGVFHGTQPVSVELEVHDQNGHADGTLVGRFKPAPGAADPDLRFRFEGDFGTAPTQKFKLTTSDGTTGTLELIPGPAFNLLEVNFQIDPQPNKIRTGNFILVKK